MAHDHRYLITFLKTPWGFLTSTGFTQDINSKDIALLPSNSYGKWSSMLTRIEFLCKYYNHEQKTLEMLCKHASECETITFYCEHGTSCNECSYKNRCKFWNTDREELKLSKLY